MTVIAGPDTAIAGSVRRRGVRRPSLIIAVSMLIVAIVIMCAVFGSYLAPYNPNAQNLILGVTTPSAQHLLGTDDFGRDILSRLIVGARAAVIGPVLIAVGAMLIGNLLGLIAGYRGGPVDYFIMRISDLVWALPGLLIAIVVVGVIGGGYYVAVVVLIILDVSGRCADRPRRHTAAAEYAVRRSGGHARAFVTTDHVPPYLAQPPATGHGQLVSEFRL